MTTGGDGLVELPPVKAGQHVRRRGEVVSRGQLLAAAGDVVTPQMVSLLAACGASEVEATPRPTVAVVVTGSELVSPGQSPAAGCIRDSNGPLLSSLVAAAGLSRPTQMWADDTQTSIAEALSRALTHADLVLTTGGVSVGSYDLVPAALRELGGETLFHGVALKPGKPILVARVGGRWLVGLPGNPLAVLVGWRVFAWPLARALAGDLHAFGETPISARLDERVPAADGRTELRPAVLYRNGTARVHVLPWKGSHDVAAAAPANALARLDPAAALTVGAAVPCYPLSWPQPGGATW